MYSLMPLGTEDERMIAKLRGFVDTIGEDYCIIASMLPDMGEDENMPIEPTLTHKINGFMSKLP